MKNKYLSENMKEFIDKKKGYTDKEGNFKKKSLKEDAKHQFPKWFFGGGPALNILQNSRINDFYYACNSLPEGDARQDCMIRMKQKYLDIMAKHGIYNENPVDGHASSFAKSMGGKIATSIPAAAINYATGIAIPLPIFQIINGSYGTWVQQKINSMEYACQKIVDLEHRERCKKDLLAYKTKLLSDYHNQNRRDNMQDDFETEAVNENATNQGWKWFGSSLIPFGNTIQNAVVNKRINDFYYACNELPDDERENCQKFMKDRYKQIMIKNQLNPNEDSQSGTGMSLVKGAAGTAVGGFLGMPLIKQTAAAFYGNYVQDKINNMEYACERITDIQAKLNCQRELLNAKKEAHAKIAANKTEVSPDLQESFNYHLNKFKKK